MPNSFRPTRLYIKRVRRSSGSYIYYFGKTVLQNIETYRGSGTYWKKIIGKKTPEHVWNSDWYHDSNELQKEALKFSLENDIENNDMWANLILEDGMHGGLQYLSKESIVKRTEAMVKTRTQNGSYKITEDSIRKMLDTRSRRSENYKETNAKHSDRMKGTFGKEIRKKAKETAQLNGTPKLLSERHRKSMSPGIFVTPWGEYNSALTAQEEAMKVGIDIKHGTISSICRNALKKVHHKTVRSIDYFKNSLGLSYSSIGFGFIPK